MRKQGKIQKKMPYTSLDRAQPWPPPRMAAAGKEEQREAIPLAQREHGTEEKSSEEFPQAKPVNFPYGSQCFQTPKPWQPHVQGN